MVDHQNLKKQVVEGSFWVLGANIISRGVSLLSTLILAKLLTPEDFGVIGYGFLIVSAIGLLREMGFNSALIYQKNEVERAASTSLVFIFLWSTFLYLIVFGLAPLAAQFFREPRLTALLRILMISLILNSLSSIPMSLLSKEINFKRRVIPELLNLTVYGIVTVIFALLGFKYWAFVIGVLTADLFQLISAMILRPVNFGLKPDLPILRELFKFGKSVMGLGILNFTIRNIDDFFVGRMLGTVSLGIYQFSYRIANIPATNITNVLGKVLFPGFTKIADDAARLRNAFLRSLHYVTYITIPVTFCIILITPDVVNLFLPKWLNAILPIQLIAYFGGVRAIGSGAGSVFLAKGKPNLLLPISLTQVVFLAVFIYPTIHYFGLNGVCLLVNLSITISIIWSFAKLKKLIDLSLFSVAKSLLIPIVLSGVIFALIMLFDFYLIKGRQYYSLILKGIGFPLLYLLTSLYISDIPKHMTKEIFTRND